jgi:hypothetical protein
MRMSDITKYIDPRNWLWWALGAGAVVAGLWFGVISPYNNYVSAKAVAAALEEERAKTEPVFKELTANFNALSQNFKDIENNVIQSRLAAAKAADTAIEKEKYRADQATSRYKQQVSLSKEWAADRQAVMVVFNELPDSMWSVEDIIAASDSNHTGGIRFGGYVKRLGQRYQSCERDLKRAIETAGRAVDRAAERGAAVEALKN